MGAQTPFAPRLRPAGALYAKETEDRAVLARFAAELQRRGWRVGGLVQHEHRDETGRRVAIDAVELDTGRRIPLMRPAGPMAQSCSLDTQALAETSGALRRAIADGVDLLVVEKFGEQEQEGRGLAEELLTAMADGIPTLVSVPVGALDTWTLFTGGTAELMAHDMGALWRWWGPRRLYRDLELGVEDGVAERVVLGKTWTLVKGPDGCGLARSDYRDSAACCALAEAPDLVGKPLRELAARVHSWDPFESAVGAAAINAHYNAAGLEGDGGHVLDALDGDEPLTTVGRFPSLTWRLGEPRVAVRDPSEGEFPSSAAPTLTADGGTVLVSSGAFADRTLPDALARRADGAVALVGPGTPLSPRLFDYGLDVLAGFVVEDADGAADAVAKGAPTAKDLRAFGRLVTLRAS